MTAEPLPLPEACVPTLSAMETSPLDPGAAAEAHLKTCTACAEARIQFLALEDSPDVLVPSGYFERLPGRILRKLPARPALHRHLGPLAWAAAAGLLMAVGAGAFLAGRANRTPYVEANLPRQPDILEVSTTDTPFHSGEEEAAQVQALSPEEMKALLERLDATPAPTR
ncbi:hypothetical protein [Geothrix alkalitolerans]|uniref:hypothetical protein n=1 Tax=Geothrix alkalitolerans TaxID=2922724 RepID=UPI001FAFA303|nr:hypothetical protein [Geothrix alkalitolerans]